MGRIPKVKGFYDGFAAYAGITKQLSKNVCEKLLEYLTLCFDELGVGERLSFYGFGSFEKKQTAPRKIGDLVTGGSVTIPSKTKIVFKQSKVLTKGGECAEDDE